jgi:hypothetical protein
MGLEADRAARDTMAATARPLVPPGAPATARDSVLLADRADSTDLLGVAEAVRPLAELCLSAEAQTPFLVGIVGPPGSGKSFALHRLVGAIEALAGAAGKATITAFQSRVVVVPLDANGVSGDPASALAAAAFVALERDRGGTNYAALADEAANGAAEPRRAAAAAAERHDEIVRRLESERAARDEVDSKRARLAEALLYETPGSRVDSFIRGSRSTIEARLRRFGLAEGDAAVNYRDLVRDLSNVSAGSRSALAMRAIWGYRGQAGFLLFSVIAFAAAVVIDRLRAPSADAAMRAASDSLAPVADWLSSHGDGLERAIEALIVVGLFSLFINLARAVSFSTLLYRGLRLLKIDVRERRRELDASAARLERRVLTLSTEAEAASKRAEALARRAGGGSDLARGPGPVFLKALDSPAKAAREFFAELARLMSAPAAPGMPTPQRLIFAIDNLEALAPVEAARLIETASALLGPGAAALVACDPAALAKGAAAASPRAWERGLFQVVLDSSALTRIDGERLAARMISAGSRAPALGLGEVDASGSSLAEPLGPSETALLMALAPLIEGAPRAWKRFHNAYRLARVGKPPRSIVALSLAALHSPDSRLAAALRQTLLDEGDRYEDPEGPPDLTAASRAARASEGKPITKADARAAWDAARRYAPADF